MNIFKGLVLDFDGVLTDNKVWVGSDGSEFVVCNKADSYGIIIWKDFGLKAHVISSATDLYIEKRCYKLGITYELGCWNKDAALVRWATENDLDIKTEVVFMGNDYNDIVCKNTGVFFVAPKDAHLDVIDIADYITYAKGGHGAVRELIEAILFNRLDKTNCCNPSKVKI
jgi:YrbI family 3-deoxy-D-manno-octulosonate 8-phosphate phosphatase